MLSASTISKYKLYFFPVFLIVSLVAGAQENSPFSRYGLGDLLPAQNIVNRAMGGFTSTYANTQNINFSNPASYSQLYRVTYDIGVTLDSRSLRSASPVQKYNSVNLAPSYVALGLPISLKNRIGLAFGIRPISNVNYSISEAKRITADSFLSFYEGSGGLYQGFAGIAKEWKNFRIGINTGYLFGKKDINTRTIPVDSVTTYKGNSQENVSYSHAFVNFGLQYYDSINPTTNISIGISGNLKQKLNAKRTVVRETYTYDFSDNTIVIDSVYNSGQQNGNITLPSSFTAGISINKFFFYQGGRYDKSMIGAEYENSKWSQYRSFGEADKLVNSWKFRLGGQLLPTNTFETKNYWSLITYRAGFYYGQEAVNADGNKLPVYGITFGAGIPIRKYSRYNNELSVVNTSFEIGKRGNSKNNITEGFFRFAASINLSDIWFIKRKYD